MIFPEPDALAPPILKLDDILLTFGGTPLLAGAGLQVEPGDRICLVGRNGSGKSTLMKIAAGLAEPQSGEIFRHPSVTIRYLHQAPDSTASIRSRPMRKPASDQATIPTGSPTCCSIWG